MLPTSELYESLVIAYDHFNSSLFKTSLPSVIFTVQRKTGVTGYFAPHRWGNLEGKKCHEIAINPSYIANSRLIEVMQTLVHEMVHCWQICFGTPGRDHYHNIEWAIKMEQLGLMPSSTGEPGGAKTGQHMADYIIEGGHFFNSFNDLRNKKNFQLKWIDRRALPRLYDPIIAKIPEVTELSQGFNSAEELILNEKRQSKKTKHSSSILDTPSYSEIMPESFIISEQPKRKTRIKYTCPSCLVKVYGKTQLKIRCEDCNEKFICE